MENFHIATRVNGKPHMTLMQIELAVTRNESIDFDIYGYRARYVPECTCKNTAHNKDDFCCSECSAYAKGVMVDDFDCWVPVGKAFSKCPSCGAKVGR